MRRIPRGVADDDRLAVVGTRAGVLVALDPRTGAIRWRQGHGLSPCAVTGDAVVAIRVADPGALQLVIVDSADGRELWTAPLDIVPPWAQHALAEDPTSSFDCTVDGDQIVIRWQARTHYEGGAAPSRRILDQHERQAAGSFRVDLRSRSVLPDPPADPTTHLEAEPTTGELAAGDLATDVVGAGLVGGLRLELAAPATTDAVVLRGVDETDGSVRWEVALDEQLQRRPPPLAQ